MKKQSEDMRKKERKIMDNKMISREELAKSLDRVVDWLLGDPLFWTERTQEEAYYEAMMGCMSVIVIKVMLKRGFLPEWPKQEKLNEISDEAYEEILPIAQQILDKLYPTEDERPN